jgi:hypothetical protein
MTVQTRRFVLGAASLMAVFVLSAASATAQCGETISVPARGSAGLGSVPLAVGDSVLYDAANQVSSYGFRINAMVCRTMAQGIAYLAPRAAALPELVVVALGTNGAVTSSQIESLLQIIGPGRGLALVTPHAGNYAYVPGLYRSAARRYPGRILVLDWNRLSAGHSDWFAPDGVHLGGAAGIDAYAHLIRSALQAMPATPTQASPPIASPAVPVAPPAAPAEPGRVVAPPRPKHSDLSSLTAAARGEIGRISTYVRLLLAAVMTRELQLLGM